MDDRRLSNPAILNQYDRPKIVVRQSPDQPDPTNQFPIYFDIAIDEPVVDFPTGNNVPGIVLSGTATGLRYTVEGARDTYRVAILSAEHDGTIEVSVPDGLCADLFGNLNVASTAEDATVVFDGSRPTCLVHSEAAGVVNNATMEIALGFSEPVFGLEDAHLSAGDATLQRKAGADGDAIYLFTVTPAQDGTIAFQLPEDVARDAVGNGNEASPVFSIVVDSAGPEVSLTSFETPGASNARLIRVRATFSEPVRGFERGDVSVAYGKMINFSAEPDGKTFIIDMRQDKGPVTLSIPAGVATDEIGNPNVASEPFHRDYGPARRPPREVEPGVSAPPLIGKPMDSRASRP